MIAENEYLKPLQYHNKLKDFYSTNIGTNHPSAFMKRKSYSHRKFYLKVEKCLFAERLSNDKYVKMDTSAKTENTCPLQTG